MARTKRKKKRVNLHEEHLRALRKINRLLRGKTKPNRADSMQEKVCLSERDYGALRRSALRRGPGRHQRGG